VPALVSDAISERVLLTRSLITGHALAFQWGQLTETVSVFVRHHEKNVVNVRRLTYSLISGQERLQSKGYADVNRLLALESITKDFQWQRAYWR